MTNPTQPTKKPRQPDPTEVDPTRGDALLKRLLQTKPKPHKDMIAERKEGRQAKVRQGKGKGA